MTMHDIINDIRAERAHADEKHGENSMNHAPWDHPRWFDWLTEEVGERADAANYDGKSGERDELIDCAAVASAWIDAAYRAAELESGGVLDEFAASDEAVDVFNHFKTALRDGNPAVSLVALLANVGGQDRDSRAEGKPRQELGNGLGEFLLACMAWIDNLDGNHG